MSPTFTVNVLPTTVSFPNGPVFSSISATISVSTSGSTPSNGDALTFAQQGICQASSITTGVSYSSGWTSSVTFAATTDGQTYDGVCVNGVYVDPSLFVFASTMVHYGATSVSFTTPDSSLFAGLDYSVVTIVPATAHYATANMSFAAFPDSCTNSTNPTVVLTGSSSPYTWASSLTGYFRHSGSVTLCVDGLAVPGAGVTLSPASVSGMSTSFVHSFIRSFVHSFIRSFIRSFVHSFIDWLVWLVGWFRIGRERCFCDSHGQLVAATVHDQGRFD